MVDIVTRLGKGSPLTNAEVDANFTNLAEVSGVTGEPMGHEDRTTSTISFNASTRTFTIAPVASSFTVWCKGKKVVVSTAQTVTIPNTTGMYSIYYDANGVLSAKSGYFTFSLEAPTAYVYWNAATGTAPYFGDERHGVVLDWQTHEYLHRTRGAALASGFSASGYVLGGNGSSNSHAQITLEGGTFFDEDMKIIVTATNTPTAGTWEQDLLSPARIPVLYLSGTGWVIDSPTDYPLKQGTSRPQYNAYSGGVWSTADVANNKYATSWILATNNLTYPVIAIIGQAENDLQSAAEAVDFTALQLPGFPSVEFRPLYKLIFQCADSCTNAVHASLVSITDIRSIAAAGTAASIVTDHGNLSGLSDDDHPQYIHVDTLRTVSAAVKASFLPSQTSNAGKFLQTDGTATSWQALTSGNVTTALGFTPYNATNPSGYISGITSGMVTTALGFTPYNATNPSGYVTAAGARGAISVTGAGSYDSATGVINIVGGVTSFNTRTGAITLSSADVTTALGFTPYNNTNPSGYITGITSTMVTTALGFTPYNSSNPNGYISSITSANVTTALGFTPYNATNPSGYITSSALSGYLTSASAASTYLPLSGGTLSGELRVNTIRDTAGGWVLGKYGTEVSLGSAGLVNEIRFNSSANAAFEYRGNAILHAGNYNSYAPTLTGGGASGTWGISISGNSATTSQRSFSNDISTTGQGRFGGWYAGGAATGPATEVGLASGEGYILSYNRNTSAYVPLNIAASAANMQFNGSTINVTSGSLQQGGNQVLHAGNYSSYALPISGGTLSGVLTLISSGTAINISGQSDSFGYNATSGLGTYIKGTGATYIYGGGKFFDGATSHTLLHAGNYSSYALPLSGGSITGHLTINNSSPTIYMRDTDNRSAMVHVNSNVFYVLRGSGTNSDSWATYNSYWPMELNLENNNASFGGSITSVGNIVLHAGNYSSYALPISGGILSGAIRAPQITAGGSTYTDANLGVQGSTHLAGTIYYGGTVGNVNSWSSLSTSSAGTHTFSGSRFIFDRYGYGSQALLDLQNGAITLSQQTSITSNLGVLRSRLTFSSTAGDANHSIYNNYNNNDGEGGWDGMKMNVYAGLRIRTGNGSGAVPTQIFGLDSNGIRVDGGIRQGNNLARPLATWGSTGATGMVIFKLPGSSGNYGMVHMVFDIYEYNSNSVSTVIVGGHNWASSWYNIGANVIGQLGKQVRLGYKDGQYCVVFGDASSYWEYGTIVFRKIHNGDFYNNIMDLGAAVSVQFTATESFSNIGGDLRALRTPASFNAGGAITQAGNQVLHAGNYQSYLSTIRTGRHEDTDGTFVFRIGSGSMPGGSGQRHINLADTNGDPSDVSGGSGITWGARSDNQPYYMIWKRNSYNNGNSTHTRLALSWHTGIEIGADPAYGGTRFFNGNPGIYGSEIMSVGRGDSNIRVTNTIYAYGYRGNANVAGTGEAVYAPAGVYSTGTNWLYGTIYTNGNGIDAGGASCTLTATRANRANGNFYIDDNYGCGVVGAYASTRYQGVFFMGDSYKMSADGTSLANMYGIGWSHPNAGGAAGNLTDHGMLIINNGGFRCAISNSIVASGNITAYSDERLKTNWRDMPDNYVSRLAQVKVGIYDRIDEKEMSQVGVSAQSLQNLLPQAIMTAKDEIGTLSVSYGNAALASAVELAKDNVALRARIERLESLINKLIGD